MQVPPAGRIGIYLIYFGFAVDVFLWLMNHVDSPSQGVLEKSMVLSPYLFPLGTILLLQSGFTEFLTERNAVGKFSFTSVGAETRSVIRGHYPLRPNRDEQSISDLPPFGLLFATTLSIVLVPCCWMLNSFRFPSQGLWASTSLRQFSAPGFAAWPQALVLRIDRERHWYLNDQPVSIEELPNRLTREFSIRADWVVYLEADEHLPVFEPAKAIDLIQGLHAKTILLTPKLRAELRNR